MRSDPCPACGEIGLIDKKTLTRMTVKDHVVIVPLHRSICVSCEACTANHEQTSLNAVAVQRALGKKITRQLAEEMCSVQPMNAHQEVWNDPLVNQMLSEHVSRK